MSTVRKCEGSASEVQGVRGVARTGVGKAQGLGCRGEQEVGGD